METLYEQNPEIRTVRAKIQGFLDYVEGGSFRTSDVYEALCPKTKQEKNNIRTGLHLERVAGSIESLGKYGVWRKVDKTVDWEDLTKVDGDLPEGMDLFRPIGLLNMFPIFPGDMIVIAGTKS